MLSKFNLNEKAGRSYCVGWFGTIQNTRTTFGRGLSSEYLKGVLAASFEADFRWLPVTDVPVSGLGAQ